MLYVQVMDFSQHHLELISKDEYKKPPSKPKEYGLITKRDTRYVDMCK